MASYTCPKCKNTLRKGSWELFTHCPDCNEPWIVDPEAPARNRRRVTLLAIIFTVLTLIPYVGILFGLFGLIWGSLTVKFKKVALGTTLMIVSAVVGLAFQPAFAWWHVGQLLDEECRGNVHEIADLMGRFHAKNGRLPVSLEELSKESDSPARCFSGAFYVYLPPAGTTLPGTASGPATASAPATAPEPETAPASKLAPDEQILVAENAATHRYFRMCVTADLQARMLPHARFDALLAQPGNAAMAKVIKEFKPPKKPTRAGHAAKAPEAAPPVTPPSTAAAETIDKASTQPAKAGPGTQSGEPVLTPPLGGPRDPANPTPPQPKPTNP